MDYKKEISKNSDNLINKAMLGTIIFIFPALFASLFRSLEIGWQNIYIIHITATIVLVSLYVFRKKLSIILKTHALLIIFLTLSLLGTLAYRIAGATYFIFVVITLGTIILGKRIGVIYLLIFITGFSAIAILHNMGFVKSGLDFNLYLNFKTTWITHIWSYLFGLTIILYVASLFYKLFTNSIKSLSIKSDELNQTLSQLQYSEERFRTFMERSPFPISIKDKSLNFIFGNQALKKESKFEDNKVKGKSSVDIFPKDISARVEEADKYVLEHDEFTSIDISSGTNQVKKHFKVIKFPIKGPDGDKLVGGITINTTEQKLIEQKLEISEKRYRSIFEGSIDGFLLSDSEGNMLEINNSFSGMLGYTKTELTGKNVYEITPEKWHKKEQDFFDSGDLFEVYNSEIFEQEFIHKNGKHIPVELNIQKLIIGDEAFYWAVVKDISERKQLEQKIFNTMIEAEEHERERYASELHDGLGPLLSTCKIYFHTLCAIDDEVQKEEHLTRTGQLLDEALNSIKEISNNLSPDILKRYGLSQAIKSFIGKLKNVTNIEFSLDSNLGKRLPETIEFTIYRIVVELINNSVKYAQASEINIDIKAKEKELKVIYSDNGKGFEYEKVKNENMGFGLTNLENRIIKIGGTYNYNSEPGKGVHVVISIKSNKS
ncbi:MAG: PAS domain S-box protein [Bacteroidota bacterium]